MIITQAWDFVTNKKNEHNTDQLELIGEEICNKHDIDRKEEECLFCCGY
jgi:regulator of replication initiation timing